MNEDPLKLAQLKDAPLKSLDDLLSSKKNDGLITVENKVKLFVFYYLPGFTEIISFQLFIFWYILNFRLTLVC